MECIDNLKTWVSKRFNHVEVNNVGDAIELRTEPGYAFFPMEHLRVMIAYWGGKTDWTGAVEDCKKFLRQVEELVECNCESCQHVKE